MSLRLNKIFYFSQSIMAHTSLRFSNLLDIRVVYLLLSLYIKAQGVQTDPTLQFKG